MPLLEMMTSLTRRGDWLLIILLTTHEPVAVDLSIATPSGPGGNMYSRRADVIMTMIERDGCRGRGGVLAGILALDRFGPNQAGK